LRDNHQPLAIGRLKVCLKMGEYMRYISPVSACDLSWQADGYVKKIHGEGEK
jgi:hypothetical protein